MVGVLRAVELPSSRDVVSSSVTCDKRLTAECIASAPVSRGVMPLPRRDPGWCSDGDAPAHTGAVGRWCCMCSADATAACMACASPRTSSSSAIGLLEPCSARPALEARISLAPCAIFAAAKPAVLPRDAGAALKPLPMLEACSGSGMLRARTGDKTSATDRTAAPAAPEAAADGLAWGCPNPLMTRRARCPSATACVASTALASRLSTE